MNGKDGEAMSDLNFGKNETLFGECWNTLYRIGNANQSVRGLTYFLNLAFQCFDGALNADAAPKVAVLGVDFPEELIYAAGAVPRFILGGSLKAHVWSDDFVPRDADPVSRSILGFINAPDAPYNGDTLFLVPLTSDSMRKIAYQLTREGRNVCVVDIPPVRGTPDSMRQWEQEALRVTETIAAHTGRHVTARSLRNALDLTDDARDALREFLRVASAREDILTCSARVLVQNSYYYASDLAEWTERLRRLNAELRLLGQRGEALNRPGVLLTGSPICFPNDKILFLMEETGLSVLRYADASTLAALTPPMTRRPIFSDALIRAIADRWYLCDGSPAYTSNETLYADISGCVREGWAEGVVIHVLKGQIEYDFELERLEKLCDSCGVPVFRLETDYQYQDGEQLRIRLEAFSEMLTQNRIRREVESRQECETTPEASEKAREMSAPTSEKGARAA